VQEVSGYVHLRRYGKKAAGEHPIDVCGDGQVVYRGQRYDLRVGDKAGKQPGFGHHVDGRFLVWGADGWTLQVHHSDGRQVEIDVHGGKPIALVGKYLVHGDDIEKPWLVFDASSGAELGRVEDQRGDVMRDMLMYTPDAFDPHNASTLWLCEGSRLAELDVDRRRMARTIEAPPDHSFIGVAALADGHVLTRLRTLDAKAKQDRSGDRLALYSPAGELVRELGCDALAIHTLGTDRFIASLDRQKQFVIYDRTLEPIAHVAMHEPLRDGTNLIVALPSGREWIGNRCNGEWDHYGEPALAPTSAAKVKPAAKKPASKKSPKQ